MEEYLNSYIVGDNLENLRNLPSCSVDCIYTDPVYNTGRNFHDYDDRFESIEAYRDFIDDRIKECHRVLKSTGVIIVHVEPRISHIHRCILDKYFGFNRFVNEIVWKTGGHAKNKHKLGRQHDTIIVYSKTAKYTFNPLYKEYDEKYMISNKPKVCSVSNKLYITTAAHNSKPDVNPRLNLRYEWNGHHKQWYFTREKMQELHDQHRLEYNKNGVPRIKRYIDDMDGIPVTDWFDDISNVQKGEKLDYATQKPINLINRLIKMFTSEGNIVLDIFAGSGTVGRSCIGLKRSYILFDISENAKNVFEQSIANDKHTEQEDVVG
jgi:adenine-specific DNA-methyltransferase